LLGYKTTDRNQGIVRILIVELAFVKEKAYSGRLNAFRHHFQWLPGTATIEATILGRCMDNIEGFTIGGSRPG